MFDGLWAAFVILGVIFLIILGAYLFIKDERDWENFKTQHHCKVTAHIEGSLSNGIGISSSGKPVMTVNNEPDKTGWLCDDGITYFRTDY